MFHVMENLPDPLAVLADTRSCLGPDGGTLVIEVQHANDFLINARQCKPFIDFTLWSQHLVLLERFAP
jgi:hypothetical protein